MSKRLVLIIILSLSLFSSGCGAAIGGVFGGIFGSSDDDSSSPAPSNTTSTVAGPTIDSINPNEGATAGGESVNLSGSNLGTTSEISLGGVLATITSRSDSQVVFLTPASASPGSVAVEVTTSGGTSTLNNGFTYYDPPTVTALTETQGPAAGGTSVTATGTNFVSGSTTVTVGGATATNISVSSTTQVSFTTPAGSAGPQDIVVSTPGGTATVSGGFTYQEAPTATNVSPAEGPISGGTTITITGTNFVSGSTTVTIGGKSASNVTVNSTTELTAETPSSSTGTAQDVTVTTPGGSDTLSSGFTYFDSPTITSLSPAGGPTSGGTNITIKGTQFVDGSTTVTIDGNSVSNLSVVSTTEITATTPAGSSGSKTVQVTTPGGSTTSSFIYDDSPPSFLGAISTTAISPTSVEISWNAASDNLSSADNISYKVYFSTSAGGQDFSSPQFTSDPGVTSFNVGLLQSTTTYFFVVRAVDEAGNTESNVVEVTGTTLSSNSLSWTTGSNMVSERKLHTATLLSNGKILFVGGFDGSTPTSSAEIYDPYEGTFSSTGSLNTARQNHTATLLPDGKVLIVGGQNSSGPLTSAEIYDPSAGTFSTTDSLAQGRFQHTATLLSSTQVLIAGGSNSSGAMSSAEIYSTSSSTFSTTGSLNGARYQHTATLLTDGQILLIGGLDSSGAINTAELYDPDKSTFTSTTGSLTTARYQHTSILLADGTVLVAGGLPGPLDSLEIFTLSSQTFAAATDTNGDPVKLSAARANHTAVLLPSGQVLLSAGLGASGAASSCEIYDAASGSVTSTGSLSQARFHHTATLLYTGKVLVAGGQDALTSNSVETTTLGSGNFSTTDSLSTARFGHTATLLPTGGVLVVGGQSSTSANSQISSSEIYDFTTKSFSSSASMNVARSNHTATLLSNGKVLITGGETLGTSSFESSAELYDPDTGTFSTTGSMNVARSNHTATLLTNGKVLITGGENSGGVLQSAELYDPSTGTFSTTANPTTGRKNHGAILLESSDQVLICGGSSGVGGTLSSAEIYDTSAGTFTALSGSMSTSRANHFMALLPTGEVLIGGGDSSTKKVDLFTPSTSTFSQTSSLSSGQANSSAVILPNGRVLIVGGGGASIAEVYDTVSDTFSTAASVITSRSDATSILLPSGKVLVVGGLDGSSQALSSAELFNVGLGVASSWAPAIETIDSSSSFPKNLSFGSTVTAKGLRFRGISEASSGQGHKNSTTNHPQVILVGMASGGSGSFNSRVHRFFPLETTNVDSESFTVTLPSSTNNPPGYFMMFVISNGIPSEAKIIQLQ